MYQISGQLAKNCVEVLRLFQRRFALTKEAGETCVKFHVGGVTHRELNKVLDYIDSVLVFKESLNQKHTELPWSTDQKFVVRAVNNHAQMLNFIKKWKHTICDLPEKEVLEPWAQMFEEEAEQAIFNAEKEKL